MRGGRVEDEGKVEREKVRICEWSLALSCSLLLTLLSLSPYPALSPGTFSRSRPLRSLSLTSQSGPSQPHVKEPEPDGTCSEQVVKNWSNQVVKPTHNAPRSRKTAAASSVGWNRATEIEKPVGERPQKPSLRSGAPTAKRPAGPEPRFESRRKARAQAGPRAPAAPPVT